MRRNVPSSSDEDSNTATGRLPSCFPKIEDAGVTGISRDEKQQYVLSYIKTWKIQKPTRLG